MYNYEIIVTVNFLFYPQQRKLVYLIQVALLKTNSYEIFNNNVAPRSVIMAITLIYQLNFIPLFIVGGFSIYPQIRNL